MAEQSKALATVNAEHVVAVRKPRPLIMSEFIQQEEEQRNLIGQYIRGQMREGTDFGNLPGTETKVLFKPGAEKLVTLFRCVPEFIIEDKLEDWDKGHFYYRFTCRILTVGDGAVVAEGVGSCSSYESKYRWRQADRTCPNCGLATIKKSRFPPKDEPHLPPGWYCFAKVGGCGANFYDNDPSITGQPVGRVINPDLLDTVNTVLKMGKKRALVDAALSLARCSDIFTQDLDDDMDLDGNPKPNSQGADRTTPNRSGSGKASGPKPAEQPAKQPAKAADPKPATPPAGDIVEGEIVKSNESREAAKTPPAAGDITDATREKVLKSLHDVGQSWRAEKVRTRISEIIGREVPVGAGAGFLNESEGIKVCEVMAKALADANAKKAAKEEKAKAKAEAEEAKAKADKEAAELAGRLGGEREPGDDDLSGEDFEGNPDADPV